MSTKIATAATITQVDRYEDKVIPHGGGEPFTRKYYCFHMETAAGHARSFVKRANKGGLSQWFRDSGYADDKSETVKIDGGQVSLTAIVKKNVPADEHGPDRMVLTHVKLS